MTLLLGTVLISMSAETLGFTAYDCAGVYTSETLRYGQFDLTRVSGACESGVQKQYENVTSKRTQVIKFIPNPKVSMINCEIKVDLYIGNCGAGFLTTMAHQMKPLYKNKGYQMTKLNCATAYRNGTWKFEVHGHILTIESKGQDSIDTAYLYGEVYDNSACRGETFEFARKTHYRSILKADVKLTASTVSGHLSTNLSDIYIRDKIKLTGTEGHGYDDQFGTFIWNTSSIPSNPCERFKTVFAGEGDYYSPREGNAHLHPMLMAQSKDREHSATLKLISKTSVCGREAYRSNLDNIYVLLHGTYNEHLYTDLDTQTIADTDVDLYENILAIANGNYFTTQLVLDASFAGVSSDICRQKEKNALQSLSDWERAGAALIKPGHVHGLLAKTYGETGVIFFCNKVQAEVRISTDCCKELPIRLKDSQEDAFMEPITHKITNFSTRIPCTDTIKALWSLDRKWVSIGSRGEAHFAAKPDVIQLGNSSHTQEIWKYSISKGIYSKQQVESLWRSQEVGKARATSSEQLHRVLSGNIGSSELEDWLDKVPSAVIANVQEQVLSPGMYIMNKVFKYLKFIFLSVIILAVLLAVMKCYIRAGIIKNGGSTITNTCSNLTSILSTVGLMSNSRYQNESNLQCTKCDSAPDMEKMKSDIRLMRIQIDELFYICKNLKCFTPSSPSLLSQRNCQSEPINTYMEIDENMRGGTAAPPTLCTEDTLFLSPQ